MNSLGPRDTIVGFLAALVSVLAGCTLLEVGSSAVWTVLRPFPPDERQSLKSGGELLKPLPKPRHAVELDIYLAEQPADDPRLGEELWREIDEVGVLPARVRESLQAGDFRVGRVGAVPPRPLQELLESAVSSHRRPSKRETEHVVRQRVILPSGSESEIPTSAEIAEGQFPLQNGETVELTQFEQARCVLRMTARKLREGWVVLRFQPEIHHGPPVSRPTHNGVDWRYKHGREIKPLRDHAFELTLNVGEYAVFAAGDGADVVTEEGERSRPLAQHFFHGGSRSEDLERLLVVRLVDVSEVKPVYSN